MGMPTGAATGGMPRFADHNVPRPYSAEAAQNSRSARARSPRIDRSNSGAASSALSPASTASADRSTSVPPTPDTMQCLADDVLGVALGVGSLGVGSGRDLIHGDGTPIAMIIVGPSSRQSWLCSSSWRPYGTGGRSGGKGMMRPPASAALHGSRQPHHPDLL
jgi:hypothetical protein